MDLLIHDPSGFAISQLTHSPWVYRMCCYSYAPLRLANRVYLMNYAQGFVVHRFIYPYHTNVALQWRHKERDGVSNHRRLDCSLDRLFMGRSQKTSKLRVTGFWERNSPVTGEFPSQRTSNAKNVSIWWRNHGFMSTRSMTVQAPVSWAWWILAKPSIAKHNNRKHHRNHVHVCCNSPGCDVSLLVRVTLAFHMYW